MCALVISIPKKEQAIVVLLEALDEDVKAENDKLDLTFKAEKVDDTYSAYSNFNVFCEEGRTFRE